MGGYFIMGDGFVPPGHPRGSDSTEKLTRPRCLSISSKVVNLLAHPFIQKKSISVEGWVCTAWSSEWRFNCPPKCPGSERGSLLRSTRFEVEGGGGEGPKVTFILSHVNVLCQQSFASLHLKPPRRLGCARETPLRCPSSAARSSLQVCGV